MKCFWFCCVLATALTACGGSMLHVTADEHSIEERLGRRLEQVGLAVTMKELKGGDKVVFMGLRSKDLPDFGLVLDTGLSSTTHGGESGTVVIMMLLAGVSVPPARRAEVMEAINAFHAKTWGARFFIDTDGDLLGSSAVNIEPEYGVSIYQIEDAVQRLMMAWYALYPKISDVVDKKSTGAS